MGWVDGAGRGWLFAERSAGKAARFAEGFAEDKFDLGVETSEVVVRPALHGRENFLVYA